MDRIQYNILKEKYGKVASWLIYDEDYGNYEKNFLLIERSVATILNPKYLFCGLNAALDTQRVWEPFHCRYRGSKGKLLRDTFNNSKVFIGSYVTDLIKEHVNSKSQEVIADVKSNTANLNRNMDIFKQEIDDLKIGSDYPRIFAIGRDVYNLIANSNIGRSYNVEYIPHYSAYGRGTGMFLEAIKEKEREILSV